MTTDPAPRPRPLPLHLSLSSGLLMGSADAIPGVSGGTIALILGIYHRFIEALGTVVKTPLLIRDRDGRGRILDAFRFLVPLALGLLAAYYVVTKLLVGKSDDPGLLLRADTAPICFAFFFGLVLVSLREPWRRIERPGVAHVVAAALGCAGAVIFVGLPYGSSEPTTWMLLLGGAGAISVMLLPGVSGSLFLVIIGQYQTVAGAVHERAFGTIFVFLAGIALGVATFVPALRVLLRRHHDVTMAALTGMMAGSLRALWPWKTGYDPKAGQMLNVGVGDGVLAVVAAAIAGGAVVWLLAVLERRIERAGHGAPNDVEI